MSARLPVVILLLAALSASACGRRADLDRPSVVAAAEARGGEAGETPPQEDRRFILDGLID